MARQAAIAAGQTAVPRGARRWTRHGRGRERAAAVNNGVTGDPTKSTKRSARI
jgi:hypothetical protein